MAMMTLRDAISLAKSSTVDPISNTIYNSAIKGGYVLSPSQAVNETTRMQSGVHLKDNGNNEQLVVNDHILPTGKLPNHPTFSTESPYNIQGLAASQGGVWNGSDEAGWNYTPSQHVLDTQGREGLARYFADKEKASKLILPYK